MANDPMIYAAMGNSTLSVWALVGDGQLASVALDGKIGNSDSRGNFFWALGLAAPFKGKTLAVDAAIQDVNPRTNRASLTFILYQVAPDVDDTPQHRRNLEFFPSIVLELPENGSGTVHNVLEIL